MRRPESITSTTRKGFLIGIGCGLVALGISYLFRVLVGGPFLPEIAAEALFSLAPGQVESGAVEKLGSLAKFTAFGSAIAINVLLYGAIGAIVYRYFRGLGKSPAAVALEVAAIAYVFEVGLGTLFLNLARALAQSVNPLILAVDSITPQLVFGALLTLGHQKMAPAPSEICQADQKTAGGLDRRRRLFIRYGLASAVAAAILFYGVDLLFESGSSGQTISPAGTSSLYSQEVTTNQRFYRVDVNIFTPSVDSAAWHLAMTGLVDNPLTMSYADVKAMPSVEQYNTLECVSNVIGGELISTGRWTGVRLRDVLANAGVKKSAAYAVFKCADGYDVGIPLERALLDGTILAYELNGVPLPQEHGFPTRAIVPGLYGMMNAKWITEIQLVDSVYQGYWQRRGWTNDARYTTMSDVVIPGQDQISVIRFNLDGTTNIPLAQDVPIAGIAFAGDRGISKVEVSTDGGKSWVLASVKDPLSDNTWVLWHAGWNPAGTGNYSIVVRATDKTGAVQTAEMRDPYPDGSTGYHTVNIRIKSSQTTTST